MLVSKASRFRLPIRAWAILVLVTALTAGCSGDPAEAPVPVRVSTATTAVTITASDGAPSGPLSTRVLTDRVDVAHLADMVNDLRPMPLTRTAVSCCGIALPDPLSIDVTFTPSHDASHLGRLPAAEQRALQQHPADRRRPERTHARGR